MNRNQKKLGVASGSKTIYPLKRRLVIVLLAIGLCVYFGKGMLMGFLFGPLYERLARLWTQPAPVIIYKEAPKPKLVLKTSFSDDRSTMVHQKYGTMMDACRILKQCFKGSDVYGTDEGCKRNLDPTIIYYNSAFLVEEVEGREDRLVGFASIHYDMVSKSKYQHQRRQAQLPPQNDDYHAFMIYNVCIDEERRGQGLGKKLIPLFLDAMIRHYKLEKYAKATGKEIDPETGKPIPPLLIGLDVDLTSETMAEAFSLYVKLGFVRWWSPCSNVGNHKWTSIIDTQLNYDTEKQGYTEADVRDAHGNVRRPAGLLPTRMSDFPIARLLWDPKTYLKNAFNLGSPTKIAKKPNHFCMYKFHADSFQEMAKMLLLDPDVDGLAVRPNGKETEKI